MKINKQILKLLKEATNSDSYDWERFFEKALDNILNKKTYLEFLDFIKTLKDSEAICRYFTIYPNELYKGKGKIVDIEMPSGFSDGYVKLDDGTGFRPAAVIKYFQNKGEHIFIINS